jgi:hypothetical protein
MNISHTIMVVFILFIPPLVPAQTNKKQLPIILKVIRDSVKPLTAARLKQKLAEKVSSGYMNEIDYQSEFGLRYLELSWKESGHEVELYILEWRDRVFQIDLLEQSASGSRRLLFRPQPHKRTIYMEPDLENRYTSSRRKWWRSLEKEHRDRPLPKFSDPYDHVAFLFFYEKDQAFVENRVKGVPWFAAPPLEIGYGAGYAGGLLAKGRFYLHLLQSGDHPAFRFLLWSADPGVRLFALRGLKELTEDGPVLNPAERAWVDSLKESKNIVNYTQAERFCLDEIGLDLVPQRFR